MNKNYIRNAVVAGAVITGVALFTMVLVISNLYQENARLNRIKAEIIEPLQEVGLEFEDGSTYRLNYELGENANESWYEFIKEGE